MKIIRRYRRITVWYHKEQAIAKELVNIVNSNSKDDLNATLPLIGNNRFATRIAVRRAQKW